MCICADDFGQHAGVNEAVQRLAESGRLHATGALVGAPAWRAGASLLRRLDATGLDVGLHLDLTEFPRTLQPRPLRWWVARGLLHVADRAALRGEIGAQLEAFEAALGHGPAFVDGHRHVHQLPCVRDELLAELRRRYGRHGPWIRSTRAARFRGAASSAASRFKACVIESLGAAGLAAAAGRLGFAQNRRLLGVYDFRGGAPRYLALLRDWLPAAREGDLLICHPGLGTPGTDPLGAARAAESDVLAGRAFGDLLRDGSIALEPMSRILAHPG